jgi:hypothetical protein
MFFQLSARQIVRERYFKRREKADAPRSTITMGEKPQEKKDTIRQIRRIKIPAATN